jgi:hypothetical protein
MLVKEKYCALLLAASALAPRPGLSAFAPTDAQRAAWEPVGKALKEKGRDAFPELARLLSANDHTFPYCEAAMQRICIPMDGWDMASEGSPDLLAMARKFISGALEGGGPEEAPAVRHALVYLAQKGNAGDLALMERCLDAPPAKTGGHAHAGRESARMPCRVLRTRAANTNIVWGSFDGKVYPEFGFDRYDWYSTNRLYFLPSVANTGPQAEYVYKAYWQAIGLRGGVSGRDTPYSIITNVAPELLAMRVWFDAGGNPVTGTDLSRHGISVPGLGFAGADTPAPPAAEPPDAPPAAAAARRPARRGRGRSLRPAPVSAFPEKGPPDVNGDKEREW